MTCDPRTSENLRPGEVFLVDARPSCLALEWSDDPVRENDSMVYWTHGLVAVRLVFEGEGSALSGMDARSKCVGVFATNEPHKWGDHYWDYGRGSDTHNAGLGWGRGGTVAPRDGKLYALRNRVGVWIPHNGLA